MPCGLVRNLPDVFAQLPHLQDRGLLFSVPIPQLPDRQEAQVLGAGFMFEHDGPEVHTAPPRLGEHTDEILSALGYTAAELENMRQSGIFGSPTAQCA